MTFYKVSGGGSCNSRIQHQGRMNSNNTLDLSGVLYEESIDEDKRKILYEFLTNGVLLNAIGILGIFGNIISIIILSRPQMMKSSINYLLIGLATSDTMLIITSILLFGIPAIYKYTGYLFVYYFKVYPHLVLVAYPLALIAQTVSAYLTLTVTLERFVAVCHPLQAKSLCTCGRARQYVFLIIVFSTLYNLPRFWEVQLVELTYESKYNTTLYEVSMTHLRHNPVYITIYIHWLYLIFIYFLPFTTLAVLNTAIYRQVRRANKERQRLSRLQKKEIGLATMLLCVVVVFFLCNILALVNNVLEAFYGNTLDQVVATSDMLITVNSSVNFIIYVIFGEKFKRLFLKLFCSHGWIAVGGRDSPDVNTHDDSVVSNGDGRNSHMCHFHRTGTTIVRNGSATSGNSNSVQCNTRITHAPSPGQCVYYPARSVRGSELENENVTTTFVN